MEAERQPMDADEVIEILAKKIEPGNFWLKMSVVEHELDLDSNTLGSFMESIKPQQRGSTRRQTVLSPDLRARFASGISPPSICSAAVLLGGLCVRCRGCKGCGNMC